MSPGPNQEIKTSYQSKATNCKSPNGLLSSFNLFPIHTVYCIICFLRRQTLNHGFKNLNRRHDSSRCGGRGHLPGTSYQLARRSARVSSHTRSQRTVRARIWHPPWGPRPGGGGGTGGGPHPGEGGGTCLGSASRGRREHLSGIRASGAKGAPAGGPRPREGRRAGQGSLPAGHRVSFQQNTCSRGPDVSIPTS